MEVFALICRKAINWQYALVGVYPSREDAESAACELALDPQRYDIVPLEYDFHFHVHRPLTPCFY